MSSLHRGHANLLCIVPILVYVLPKRARFLFFLSPTFPLTVSRFLSAAFSFSFFSLTLCLPYFTVCISVISCSILSFGLTALSMIISQCIHACFKWNHFVLFLWLEQCFLVYMCHILIHSSVHGNLSCFYFLAVVCSAAVSTGVHVSF